MARNKVNKQIKESKEALIFVMEENIERISKSLISQIMKNYDKLTPSNKLKAIDDLKETGACEVVR